MSLTGSATEGEHTVQEVLCDFLPDRTAEVLLISTAVSIHSATIPSVSASSTVLGAG